MNDEPVVLLNDDPSPEVRDIALAISSSGDVLTVIDSVPVAREVEALIGKALVNGTIVANATGMYAVAITTVEDEERVLILQRDLRAAMKKGAELYEPARSLLDRAKKTVLAWRDALTADWTALDTQLGATINTWRNEQRRLAEARQHAANEAARKEAEDRALAEAALLSDAGETEAAEEHLTREIEMPIEQIYVAPVCAKVAGISKPERRKAVVIDMKKFVAYCLANPILIEQYLSVNDAALNAMARSKKQIKDGEELCPGVKLEIYY